MTLSWVRRVLSGAMVFLVGLTGLLHAQSERPEWGGELKLDFIRAQGQDGPEELSRDLSALEAQLTLEAAMQLNPLLEVVGEIELVQRSLSDEPVDNEGLALDEDGFDWSVKRLYFQRKGPDDSTRWRLGRQVLDDAMGWALDENLDGLRFTRDWSLFRLDLSYTRQQWLDLESAAREDRTDNLFVRWQVQANDETTWAPWALRRSAHAYADTRAADTLWFGLQGIVRLSKGFGYWANLAMQRGKEQRENGERKLGGQAVDLGFSWTLKQSFKPTFTLGYARASGDADRGGSRDNRFRQSGLQSNEYAINRQNRFRYLGEVLDPELTNIEILTLGMGFDPGKRLAADLVYHHYRQPEPDDRLRGADVEYDPTGLDPHLGDGLDFILGYEPLKNLELQALAGVFVPGSAFGNPPDRVWLVGLQLEYGF